MHASINAGIILEQFWSSKVISVINPKNCVLTRLGRLINNMSLNYLCFCTQPKNVWTLTLSWNLNLQMAPILPLRVLILLCINWEINLSETDDLPIRRFKLREGSYMPFHKPRTCISHMLPEWKHRHIFHGIKKPSTQWIRKMHELLETWKHLNSSYKNRNKCHSQFLKIYKELK